MSDPADDIDDDVEMMVNPCSEGILQNANVCNLSEICLNKIDSFKEFCKCLVIHVCIVN